MNQQAMLKKVRQMQQEMEKAQREIESTEIVESVNGIVTVTLLGTRELLKVEVSNGFTVEGPEDTDMLCDAIVAACKRAYARIDKLTEEKLGKYSALGAGSFF